MKKFKELLVVSFFLIFVPLLFSQANEYEYKKGDHQKQIIGYFTNWDAWKAENHGVTKGFYNQLNIDYSQYTILNWSFLGVAVDGSLHSGDLRNKDIWKKDVDQEPGEMFDNDIYSSWDYWLLYGELEIIQYLPDNLDEQPNHALYWVYDKYGYKGNGSGWIKPSTGETGAYPLPVPKEGGAKGVMDLAHENNVKLMASIGGWSMSKHFPDVAADPVKRARFIKDCKELIDMGFDGIDIDWEFPGVAGMNFQGTNADYENFAILMDEIREAIGSDKLLTAAFGQTPNKLEGFDWNRLNKSMDYFNMMTYDFHGGWSNIAGHNAPLYSYEGEEYGAMSVDDTFQFLVGIGVDPNKINLGIGFYGRGVITDGNADLNVPTVKTQKMLQPDGPVLTAGDFVNWGDFDATPTAYFVELNKSGWEYHWDDQAKVPYLTKDNYFLSYDNERSIEEKAKYVNVHNAGGVIVWHAFGDLNPGTTTVTYANKLPYAPTTKAPLVNVVNKVFAEGGTPRPPVDKAPEITLISPSNNAVIKQETLSVVPIEISIIDKDGTIVSTEFKINDKLIEFKKEGNNTYIGDFTPTAFGSYTLHVKAIDNDDQSTIKLYTFKVEKTAEGGCDGVAPWEVKIYSEANTPVYHEGAIYKNKWYASESDVPGSSDAWEFVRYCGEEPSYDDTCGVAPWEVKTYSETNTEVYYDGAIYRNKWYVEGGQEPTKDSAWEYVKECPQNVAPRLNNQIETTESEVKVFLSSHSSILNIKTDKKIVKGTIYSSHGKEMKSFNSSEVQISSFRIGYYFLKVLFEDGSVEKTKFIKKK